MYIRKIKGRNRLEELTISDFYIESFQLSIINVFFIISRNLLCVISLKKTNIYIYVRRRKKLIIQ